MSFDEGPLDFQLVAPIFKSIADTTPSWVRLPRVILDAIMCRCHQTVTPFLLNFQLELHFIYTSPILSCSWTLKMIFFSYFMDILVIEINSIIETIFAGWRPSQSVTLAPNPSPVT